MPSESLLRVSSAPGGRYGTFYTRRWKLSNLDPSSPPGGRYDAFYTRRRKLSNLDPLSTESNISGPETKKSPRAKEDEMMAMCGSWASPFSQTSASQPPSELIHGQCLGDSSDCGPSRRPSLGGSPIGSDVGSDQAVARTPRAPRTSYSEEQKFFIMYARVVKDHTWPEIEDQFNAIFGFRTKGALTSVYYRVRKDWGLTEVLKTGPGSYVADCKEVERRARKFSASFLVEIGYLADSDESQTVAMLQFRHKAPQNARATVAESISLLKSAPQQHIPITQLLSTDRPSVSGSPTDFAISGEISQAASSDTGSNTHTEPQDVASANMGGSARFTQATTMGTVFDEEESDESMAPTRQCRSPEISNPHAASCDDPYLFVAVNGTTNSRDLVQMRRKRKHVLQDYLDKERKKPKTTDARITGNGKRRRLEPSLLSMSVHSGVPATMFMESRVKLVSGSQEKATWEQTVSSDSTKVMTPAPHTIHTDLLDDAKGVDQEPRPETRASSVDADVRPEEDIVEDLTASSRYSTKRHQIDQPVSEQKSRPRCASTDAVDLADAFLGLKKRLQRLLILTEPKTPSLSSDSDSEEPIDPLNFESPDGSPGLRQCASGHESSSNGSLHLADALPASGRQSSQHGRRSINDGDQEEDESIAQPGGARTSDPQSSKLQRYPCVYHVGEPQIYASHTTRWEYVSQVLRHMESHNFFMCSRCLTAFTTKEQKTLHDKMRACVKVCSNRACKRHTMNFEVSTTVCKCLLSSDDLWAATFRQAFPLVPLPIPWSTKVQSWLIDPADSDLQQDCREQDGAQWHQRLQPGLAPDNIPQQDVLNSHAMGDPLDGSGTSDRSVPQFQSDETADSTLTGFQNAISQESGSLQSNSAVVYPTTDFEGHSAQPVSQADIQLLRTQLAILEERVERPRRSEQDKSAMLRLMWNRLVEIGDQSVQEGGVLRQVATHLTPDLITDNTARNDLVQPTQAMDMRSAMDWDAAGLGPQHLPAAGNEKQRAVSGAADSAYYSGMHMR